jgi:hypothetical protein
MMRKVGKPKPEPEPKTEAYSSSQLVTTRVPGHHRPHNYQAIKVPIAALRDGGQEELILSARRRFTTFKLRQSSAASVFGKGADPWQRPKSRLFP